MKKTVLSAMKDRTELLRRIATLEEENARMMLRDAEHDAETATLKRGIANLTEIVRDWNERVGWVRTLLDGRGIRPNGLPDSKPVRS